MQNTTKATLLALMLAATPGWAQDATGEAPASEEAPATEQAAPEATGTTGEAGTEERASPEDGLSMGTPDGEEAQSGAPGPYVKETHGDWELRCAVDPSNQQEQCQIYQLLNDEGGNSVAEFTMFALPEGGQARAGANIITPLETLLTEQLTLAVDGSQGKRYPYTFCAQIGCVSRIGFTEADVNAFKAGAAARLTLVPFRAPDEKVSLRISLTGFTAAYNALREQQSSAN